MVATIQVLEIRKISLQGVLLLCYAQWCGFCASLVHIYIPLAWLLHPGNFTVASFSSSEPCTKECPHKETVLQQGRISHLEREIQKLRSEIGALHQAYDTAAQLSEARREQQKLQQQKHALEKQHNTLQLPSEQLQATHDRKNRELLEMAEKLQEVADASENLLKENTFLRFLVASREEKLQSKDEIKEFLQSEQTLSEDNAVSVSKATAAFEEKRIDNINTTETEHSSGNRTE
ncbi:thioredoxin domain-containing protein 11-like isoform X2 [Patagioenas fasciata]|uniref:thioredoxin domain-containing protein 11-like isoform X2 n=1 Tax=Patagioenas fasciata TaxID=372321 RepID=UPI003A99546B